MPSQVEREIHAGLEYIRASLSRSGLELVEYNPIDHFLNCIVIRGSGQTTDLVLSNNFICDLPATREYHGSLDSYVSALAARSRCGDPNIFYCAADVAVHIQVHWGSPTFLGDGHCSVLVDVLDQVTQKVAYAAVSLRRMSYLPSTPFDDMRLVVNRIRRAVDDGVITFVRPEGQPVGHHVILPKANEVEIPRSEAEIKHFLVAKAYLLGFRTATEVAQVWFADPWDAEYLGVSTNQLTKAAQILRAEGLLDFASGSILARPSDKLIVSGPPRPSAAQESKAQISLASLPRKEQLIQQVAGSLTRKAGLALLVIDLDHFKSVNDRNGQHSEGDLCLERVVTVMAANLGDKGTLYRWGGDEFAVLLPDFSTEEAAATAERIRCAIEEAKPAGEVHVTASVGVCGSDRMEEPSAEGLLNAADKAMYESKSRGKNCVTSWPISGKSSEASA